MGVLRPAREKVAAELPPPPKPKPWEQKPERGDAPAGITAAELFALDFPPAVFCVADLLPDVGLTVFGGRPKHGKSWLSLLLAWAVATGEAVDGRPTKQGEVLYLALEDTRRRLQGRLRMLQAATGWLVPETLSIHTAWPRADDGGLYRIHEWLSDQKSQARLVIVDTMAKFRKPQKGNSGNGYAEDYEAYGGLKELVDHYEAAALVVTHTRKLKAEDPFDEISGTLGVGGSADAMWVLDTEVKGESARLYATGRDLPDATLALSFGKTSGRWTVGPNAPGIDVSERGVTNPAEGKAAQCRQWIRDYLRVYACPALELERAGTAAGYSRSAVSAAKTELGREGTEELRFKKDGLGCWWVGLGNPAGWKRRPESGDTVPE